ncbi:MAG TPA: hypothetical protein VG432_07395 [Gemmatimonadaceae bacterium]|nr:hypothetical protein [Gemmatimonadaceae bacterium]
MKKSMMLATLLMLGALALPAAAHAQQQDAADKPITPKTVAKNTAAEAERVGKRTGKVAKKGAKDTAREAKRAAHGLRKVYSRKARQDAKGEKVKEHRVTRTSP